MTFEAAKRPECGADIQVPSDRDAVKCMYCGKDIIVRQAVQAKAGPTVQNWMNLAAAAAEAGNHEEAYGYFTRVLEVEPENYEAWLGKAVAAGWGSGLNADRFSELLAGIQRALEYAPDAEKNLVCKRGADVASGITMAYFKLSVEHTQEYIALDDTWAEHIARCLQMLTLLDVANTLDPTNRHVVKNGIAIAKWIIEGVCYKDPYHTHDPKKPFETALKTKRLTEKQEARVRRTMDEFVAKMKVMDPTYEAPKIEKVKEWYEQLGGDTSSSSGVGCVAVPVVLVIALVAGGWFFWSKGQADEKASQPVPVATVAPPPVQEPVAVPPPSQSLCGKPGPAVPKTIPGADWSKYTCISKEEAGAFWGKCVAGAVYSRKPEQGCPGDQRCCPATAPLAPVVAAPPKAACQPCMFNARCDLLTLGNGGPCCKPIEHQDDCPPLP